MGKRLLLIVLLALTAFVSPAYPRAPQRSSSTASYCASSRSNVFHRPSCLYVSRINPSNLITFETREEAQRSGRRPCKVCRP
jgi:methylphosphotriester-DNA--protein-cysteine methyltransferase